MILFVCYGLCLLEFRWAFLHLCSSELLACNFIFFLCHLCVVVVSGWWWPCGMSFGVFLPLLCVKLLQLCLTFYTLMDCSPPGSSVHGFPRQENWSGLPFLSPVDLPDPGIEPVSLSGTGRQIFYHRAMRVAWICLYAKLNDSGDGLYLFITFSSPSLLRQCKYMTLT